jgi:hypothetical protein
MRAGYIRINASLRGKAKDVFDALAAVGEKAMLVKTRDAVSLAYVESKDIKGTPQEFFIIDFKPNSIDIGYTVPDKIEAVRKWEVLSKVFPLLSVAAPYYDMDIGFMLELVGNLAKDMESMIPGGSKDVYIERDKLKSKLNEVTALLNNYRHENEELTKKLYAVGNRLSTTEAKLEKFMKFTDEVLELKISEWIRDHDGELDVKEFSQRYDVNEQRVVNTLQDMISNGYVKPI